MAETSIQTPNLFLGSSNLDLLRSWSHVSLQIPLASFRASKFLIFLPGHAAYMAFPIMCPHDFLTPCVVLCHPVTVSECFMERKISLNCLERTVASCLTLHTPRPKLPSISQALFIRDSSRSAPGCPNWQGLLLPKDMQLCVTRNPLPSVGCDTLSTVQKH